MNKPFSAGTSIVVATYGTLGDVYPYLQLAMALKKRGHRVTVASSELFRETIEALELVFRPLRPDVAASGTSVPELGRRLMDPKRGPEYVYRELLIPNVRDCYDDLIAMTRGTDLLVSHPLVLAAPLVAEKTGIAWVSSVLSPISFLSVDDPSVFSISDWLTPQRLGASTLGTFLIRLLRKGVRQRLRSWSKPIQQLRADLGLPSAADPLLDGQHAPGCVLALFSPLLGAPQRDWPAQARATGFLFYDAAPLLPPSTALASFLAAGPPPVVFTLGSSAIFAAGTFYAESLKAVGLLGCRAVLLTGGFPQEGLSQAVDNPDVLLVDYAPHQALFDQAAVVVHQGGVGTTAQVLRAGRPMLIVPHAHDQPDNAVRARRLGVGRILTPPHYSARRVAAELTYLLTDPVYQQHADQVRIQLAAEDGTESACLALENQLVRHNQQPVRA
ncbi:glycosyltransferase [Fibrella arboris]|uniref:glycosyltransferase n=1 Tax=Fibrella arboris TaxID=3242486 RepID=UPI0035220304